MLITNSIIYFIKVRIKLFKFKMSSIKNISLYIPHVFANYSKEDIAENMTSFGVVSKIDFVSKMGKDGKPYNAAYIHFDHWFNTSTAANFQERVLNPEKEARVMYDDPWFWIVLENKAKKHTPGDRKPRIDLEAFGCHSDVASESFKTPEKLRPINLSDLFAHHAKNQAASEEITQEEMDEAYDEMMRQQQEEECLMEEMMGEDDKHLVSIDIRYVKSLEDDNLVLTSQVNNFSNVIEDMKTQVEYYKNLYWNEANKTKPWLN